MPVRILLQPGDCFSIPLADGRLAFGQYVCQPEGSAPLIRVFDVTSTEVVSVATLKEAGLMFPPILVGLNPPVRIGRWRKIGNFPIDHFEFPKFRSTLTHIKGTNHDWRIWDGETYENIGNLPPEYRSLEMTLVYAYGDVEERIVTGRNPFTEGIE